MKNVTLMIMIVLMCSLFFFAFFSIKESMNHITAEAVADTNNLFEETFDQDEINNSEPEEGIKTS